MNNKISERYFSLVSHNIILGEILNGIAPFEVVQNRIAFGKV
jgi:hypothetical protein